MRLFWGILGLLLLALPIRADALYDVTGTITLTGNDTCNGRCIETIDFSFQFDEQRVQSPYPAIQPDYEAFLANDLSITFSGPLVASYTGNYGFSHLQYMGFFLGNSMTEYDLTVGPAMPTSEGITYPFTPIFGGYLYSCGVLDGCYGFCPQIEPYEPSCNDPTTAGTQTIEETVTPESPMSTPEPQTWAMLWFGLIGLAVMKFAPREKRLKAWLPLVLAAAIFARAQPGHL
jgi:hypothetical protein